MATLQEARQTIAKRFGSKQDRLDAWPAYLGNEDGTVAGSRQGYVYVRYPTLTSAAVEVYNGGVPEVAGLRVMIGYRPENPNLIQALGVADIRTEISSDTPYGTLPSHGRQHFWTGSDPVYIDFRQITGLRVYPGSGIEINVYEGFIQRADEVIEIPAETISLTSSVPSTDGQGRYTLISIDSTGDIIVTDGTAVDDYTALTVADIPATPSGNFRLAAVRLYYGQTTISDRAELSDIFDLRWPQEGIAGLLPVAQITGATAQYQYIVSGADPYTAAWSAGFLNIASGKTVTISDDLTVGSLTSGRVLFASADDTIGDDANLTWNGTTKTLTIKNESDGNPVIITAQNSAAPNGIQFLGGDDTTDSAAGGQISFLSGAGGAGYDGGSFTLQAGTGGYGATGGQFTIAGGNGGEGGGGNGGDLILRGGDAQSEDADGGQVYIYGGNPSGSGSAGTVRIHSPVSGMDAILDVSVLDTSNKTFTFPNTSGTFALGTGTAGRIAEWAATNTLQASTLIKSGAGVLTLSAASDYTLTVPATGTAALLATANVFTAYQTVNVSSNVNALDISLDPNTETVTALHINHTRPSTGYVDLKLGDYNSSGYGATIRIETAYGSHLGASVLLKSRSTSGTEQTFLTALNNDRVIIGPYSAANSNGRLNIVGVADIPQFIVIPYSSQTANLFEFRDTSGNLRTVVNAAYQFIINSNGTASGVTYQEVSVNGDVLFLGTTSVQERELVRLASSLADSTDASYRSKIQIKTWAAAGEHAGLTIEDDGAAQDVYFEGGDGSGLPYGNLYAYEANVTVTVSSSGSWYEITSGMSGGDENLCTFQNSHEILVIKAGRYLCNWSLGITSGTNDEIMGTVGVNSSAVTKAANHATVSVSDRYESVAGTTILDLAASDVVSLFVLNETAAADITMEHATLTLVQVGGT
jgi:hypothetical protein